MTLVNQIRKMKTEALKQDIEIKQFGVDRKLYKALQKELEVTARYSNQLEHIEKYIILYGIKIHPIGG